jgi:hypothetical protein
VDARKNQENGRQNEEDDRLTPAAARRGRGTGSDGTVGIRQGAKISKRSKSGVESGVLRLARAVLFRLPSWEIGYRAG